MILLFGGTTEGRAAIETLESAKQPYYYSTKTPGQKVDLEFGQRVSGGFDCDKMVSFCIENKIKLIVDAAHPFAEELRSNIVETSRKLDLKVIRYSRVFSKRDSDIIWCNNFDDALAKLELEKITKLVALTGVNTISKLKPFWTKHQSWFRIIDREESHKVVEICGYPKERLLFFDKNDTKEESIRSIMPEAIITKESGSSGYFSRKIDVARSLGIKIFAVKVPTTPSEFIEITESKELEDKVRKYLPRFFPLRSGFTTGACATAATKAALSYLLTGKLQDKVSITLPRGETIIFDTFRSELKNNSCEVVIKKYSGDDPDVTDGILIHSTVKLNQENRINFLQGDGVGTFTLDGFGVPIGEPAINPVPRQMMINAVDQILKEHEESCGVDITISVPGGDQLAKKTFNPKLGIVNGISIIGTTGIIKPFSTDAFIRSIFKEIDVAKANGITHLVINSGAKSERYIKDKFSTYSDQAFVQFGNFIGETVKRADQIGISKITVAVMLGKAVKLAEGHLDTHSKKVVMNREFIKEMVAEAGYGDSDIAKIDSITLARSIWDLFNLDSDRRLIDVIKNRCQIHCSAIVKQAEIEIILVSPDGSIC